MRMYNRGTDVNALDLHISVCMCMFVATYDIDQSYPQGNIHVTMETEAVV